MDEKSQVRVTYTVGTTLSWNADPETQQPVDLVGFLGPNSALTSVTHAISS